MGGTGLLECRFKEGREKIHSLRWFLNSREFYRWVPNDSPSMTIFNLEGTPLLVDKSASQEGRVRIRSVRIGAAGVYYCQVSGGSHNRTKVLQESAYMRVVGECQAVPGQGVSAAITDS